MSISEVNVDMNMDLDMDMDMYGSAMCVRYVGRSYCSRSPGKYGQYGPHGRRISSENGLQQLLNKRDHKIAECGHTQRRIAWPSSTTEFHIVEVGIEYQYWSNPTNPCFAKAAVGLSSSFRGRSRSRVGLLGILLVFASFCVLYEGCCSALKHL